MILRVAWMQLVLEFNLKSLHKVAVSTIISCLEIVRRGMWSFFRYMYMFCSNFNTNVMSRNNVMLIFQVGE